jgi:hypothetical protein
VPEILEIGSRTVNLKLFEYVLKLSERTGLKGVPLIRYLKSDGFTTQEAAHYTWALDTWNKE